MTGRAIKILLVDDDEDDYIMTKDLLLDVEGNTYDLEWASTYEAAIESISRTCHDVLLFDYRLGAHTGLDLLREALAAGCAAPVILLTGQKDHNIDIEAIKAGATDYLNKAEISTELLERSIRYALQRKRTEDRIVRMAYYDSLTNLPNRVLFQDRLKQCIAHLARYKGIAAILFIDLDNFKRINDTLEHRIGDLLLIGVADRLSQYIRSSDTVARNANVLANTVARLGGDEFTVLLTDLDSAQSAGKVAQRILTILAEPFHLDGHEAFVSASIGIALYPCDGQDMDTLIKNADSAMYHAKEEGKNNFQFYEKAMNDSAIERLSMENGLRKAIQKNELVLYYQPRFNIARRSIVGTEALLRWDHPERGLVPPSDFIPLAEDSGLIIPVGEWVMQTACLQNKSWHDEGLMPMPIAISVNLSARQFREDNLIRTVDRILEVSGLDPQYLEFEITESVIMKDADITIEMLKKLKDRGIHLSMDDFGTGYSSFSYLKRFPLDNIKIDRSFIKDMTRDSEDEAIVKAIIAMAHTLKLNVVAEGVETEEQLSMLSDLDCDEMQGFLLSRPLPPDEASRYLAQRKYGKKKI